MTTDREAQLLRGPVASVEIRAFEYNQRTGRWRPGYLPRVEALYDRCGNVTELNAFWEIDGERRVISRTRFSVAYRESGCIREGAKVMIGDGAGPDVPESWRYEYGEHGKIVRFIGRAHTVSYEREGGNLVGMVLEDSADGASIRYAFDAQTGRLRGIEREGGSSHVVHWTDDDSIRVESESDPGEWIGLELDGRGNIVEVRYPPERLFGQRFLYTWRYDERGNWTEHLSNVAIGVHDEIPPTTKIVRVLTYYDEP